MTAVHLQQETPSGLAAMRRALGKHRRTATTVVDPLPQPVVAQVRELTDHLPPNEYRAFDKQHDVVKALVNDPGVCRSAHRSAFSHGRLVKPHVEVIAQARLSVSLSSSSSSSTSALLPA